MSLAPSASSRQLPTTVILAIIGLGAFITALDQTVVVTALPSVMVDLKVPITQLDRVSWVITSYLLGYTVAMPLIGRLGDVYGYPRVYQASLVVFCIGTALVAISPSLEWMVGSRVVQAVGGGATVPIGMALAVTLAPPGRRALALGIVGAAAEAGSMLGPVYGGAIVELLSWRWIFWLNIPQSAVIFVALMWLPNRRNPEARVDYWGGALLIAALTVLSLALSRGDLFTFDSPLPFVMAALGIALIVALVMVERRVLQPLLSAVFLRSWGFLSANMTQALVGVSLIIAMVTVPLLADTVIGKPPFTGALWLLRMTGAIPLGALLGAVLLGRVGVRPVTVAGLALVAAGMFLASGWDLGIAEPALTIHLVMAGLGFGLVIAPILVQALTAVTEDYRGTAASLVVVSRMMGMTLGLAALSAWGVEHFQVLTTGLEFPLPTPGETPEALDFRVAEYSSSVNAAGLSLFQNFFRVAGIIALAAIPSTLAMRQPVEGHRRSGVKAG
jgi:EmrB/QacA subfamily drug resistance transporter